MPRTDYYLSNDPMTGPTPRQERALDVAARFNSLYRLKPSHPKHCQMVRVLRRWDEKAGEFA